MADDESFDLSGDLDDFLNEDSSSALDLGTDFNSDDLGLSGIDSAESEELAPLESSADFGADLVEDADDQIEETAPAATAAAGAGAATASAVVAPKRRGMLSSFSIFDAMLVFSLILVTAAALMMAYGLNDYGSVFGLPWKTTGITVK